MSSPNKNLPKPDNVPGELSLSPTIPHESVAADETAPTVDVPSDISPTGDSSNSGEGADPGFTAEDQNMLQKRDNDILQDLIQNLSVQTTNLDSPESTSTGTISVLGSSKTPTLSTDPEDGSSVLGTPSSDTGEGVLIDDKLLQAIQQRLPESVDQSAAQTSNAPGESNLKMETDSESLKDTPDDSPDEPKPIVEKQKEPTPKSNIPSLPPLPKLIPSPATKDRRKMETDSESLKDTPEDSRDEPKPIVEKLKEQEPRSSVPSLTPLPKYVTSPPTKDSRKMETDSGSPEDSPDEPKAIVKEQPSCSSIPHLPPFQQPASLPTAEGSLSQSESASAPPFGPIMVRIPLVTKQPESPKNNVSDGKSKGMKSKFSSDGDDSSLSISGSISLVEKPYKVAVSKGGDSSDESKPGSEADESSQSCCASPDTHRKKAFHKKVHRDSTGTTPSLQAIRSHQPPLSRADTLDDVETIKTDPGSPLSRQISPDRDRRAVSVPADPPTIDPKTAPEERRAYSEAKETEISGVMETDNVPEPPYPSLETSVSWPASSTESTEPERQVQSEPVKGWAKVVPVQKALSEGHTPASSFAEFSVQETSCIPEVQMLEDPRAGDDYAADRSCSTSDVDPMRERPRREDREADRQVREFNEALAAAAEISSGRGTDSNAPSSTLGTSEENRLAPIIGGYQGWFQQPAENVGDDEEGNQSESKSSSEQSTSKSTSSGMDDYFQTLDSYFRPSSEGEPQAGPSGKKSKEQLERMDLLEVIPEKGESLSASPKSLSPILDDEATTMAEPEDGAKSCMVLKLEDDEGQRTPKRKRDRKKSGDSPKDPEVQSPGDDSRKRYCSEFSRPVMAEGRVRRCSTGSVTPFQAQNVNVASLKELAQKSVKKDTKGKQDPKDETKDKKDPKDRQGPSA